MKGNIHFRWGFEWILSCSTQPFVVYCTILNINDELIKPDWYCCAPKWCRLFADKTNEFDGEITISFTWHNLILPLRHSNRLTQTIRLKAHLREEFHYWGFITLEIANSKYLGFAYCDSNLNLMFILHSIRHFAIETAKMWFQIVCHVLQRKNLIFNFCLCQQILFQRNWATNSSNRGWQVSILQGNHSTHIYTFR